MVSILQLRAVDNPGLRQFIEAWLQWQGDALVPRRAQLDLVQIKTMLPFVALLELRGPDEIRFRVAGTGIANHLGRDPTGLNFRDITPPEQWRTRAFRLQQMAARPCGGAMHHEDWMELKRIALGVLTLPLQPDQEGGAPLMLSHVAALEPLPPEAAGALGGVARLPNRFTYVDIGAGVPDATEPA